MGRPTKYKSEYCEKVVELMSKGMSKNEVAANLGVDQVTLYNWADKHIPFFKAIKRGEQLSLAWWESEGRRSLREKEFNHVLWYMNMKNRHGWRDKQEVTGANGDPIVIKDINAGD